MDASPTTDTTPDQHHTLLKILPIAVLVGLGLAAGGIHFDWRQGRQAETDGGFEPGHVRLLMAYDGAHAGRTEMSEFGYSRRFGTPPRTSDVPPVSRHSQH